MSYRSEYGCDWDDLSRDEAIERGYALGIAAELGEDLTAEFERVLNEVETPLQRSLVKLAFDEGKKAVTQLPDGCSTEEIWEQTLASEPIELGDEERPRGVPTAVTRIQLLDPPGDDLDRVRLPDFLTR